MANFKKLKFNYNTSKDYDRLYVLMQNERVVCFIKPTNESPLAVVSNLYFADNKYLQVGCVGTTYIVAKDKESFIKSCKRYDLEYIESNRE